MIIQHNISAMNANRQMGINSGNSTKSMEKLSSGFAINRAGDNAAGLSISEKMRSQVRGLNQASKNSQDGISLIQTAEGALSETHSILQRMRELADQSANGTNTSIDRGAIQDEIKQLTGEIDRIGNTTEFNTKKLLNGALAGAGEGSEAVNATGAVIATGDKGNLTASGPQTLKVVTQEAASETLKGKYTATQMADFNAATSVASALSAIGVGASVLTTASALAAASVTADVAISVATIKTASAGSLLADLGGTGVATVASLVSVGSVTATQVANSLVALSGSAVAETLGLTATLSAAAASSVAMSPLLSKADALVVDGNTIKLDWSQLLKPEDNTYLSNLSVTELSNKTTSDKVRGLLEEAINKAIAASGTSAQSIKVSANTPGAFKIESGTKGTNSRVELYSNETDGKPMLFDKTASRTSNSLLNVLGIDRGTSTKGEYKVNANIASGETMKVTYAGQEMQISLASAVGGATTLKDLAADIEAKIGSAVDAQNAANGVSAGDDGYLEKVLVKASDDGRLTFEAPSGEIGFKESAGGTGDVLDRIGLSNAALESAGTGGVTLQIGANKGQTLSFSVADMRASALGITGVDCSTQTGASNALTTLDKAIQSVSNQRSRMGAVQNRLEHTISNLGTSSENLTAAESRIRDTDMASEMMNYTKNNILSQAAQSMLAQANQKPQSVLQLLG